MRKVKIITGSCADLSGKQLEQYNNEPEKKSTLPDGYTVLTLAAQELFIIIEGLSKAASGDIFADEYKPFADKTSKGSYPYLFTEESIIDHGYCIKLLHRLQKCFPHHRVLQPRIYGLKTPFGNNWELCVQPA